VACGEWAADAAWHTKSEVLTQSRKEEKRKPENHTRRVMAVCEGEETGRVRVPDECSFAYFFAFLHEIVFFF
jgi:hypothetical protein